MLAETPPARRIEVGRYCRTAWSSFSIRMAMAVCWKEAAKSAICWLVSLEASSKLGVEMGRFSSFWTARRTAVLRPEKEKFRPGIFG